MASKNDKNVISIEPIEIKTAEIYIVGDTDLIINKTAASYERECIAKAEGKTVIKQDKNYWEDVITSVRWSEPFPVQDTKDLKEEHYIYA